MTFWGWERGETELDVLNAEVSVDGHEIHIYSKAFVVLAVWCKA